MISLYSLAIVRQKHTVCIFLSLLLMAAILTGCVKKDRSNMGSVETMSLLEYEDIYDVTLTIYFSTPYSSIHNLSVEDLIYEGSREYDIEDGYKLFHKFVVDGNRLADNIDLLDRINNATLTPLAYDCQSFIRVYYVFESAESGKLLEVAFWGERNDILEEDIIWL